MDTPIKIDYDKLSLKDLGCTGDCCKHGTPYVLLEERDFIVALTQTDYFVRNGNHFFIGKNQDGSERDLSKDPCPYFRDGCKLQELRVKPFDCSIHPLFARRDDAGRLEFYISDCCEIYKRLPLKFIEEVKRVVEQVSNEHLDYILESQQEFGFPLKKIIIE